MCKSRGLWFGAAAWWCGDEGPGGASRLSTWISKNTTAAASAQGRVGLLLTTDMHFFSRHHYYHTTRPPPTRARVTGDRLLRRFLSIVFVRRFVEYLSVRCIDWMTFRRGGGGGGDRIADGKNRLNEQNKTLRFVVEKKSFI